MGGSDSVVTCLAGRDPGLGGLSSGHGAGVHLVSRGDVKIKVSDAFDGFYRVGPGAVTRSYEAAIGPFGPPRRSWPR